MSSVFFYRHTFEKMSTKNQQQLSHFLFMNREISLLENYLNVNTTILKLIRHDNIANDNIKDHSGGSRNHTRSHPCDMFYQI